MMEDLVRLTMVPLSDTPLEFEGNMVYELTQQGRTSVGELRWGERREAPHVDGRP